MQSIRVVIADDEPALRDALSDLIEREPDLSVLGKAADADEAVRLAREFEPDIVLLDVKMPAGGGPRATREISQACEFSRVLAVSAYEDRSTVLEMMQAGAVGYVVKGAPPNELVEAIRRAVRGQASLSAAVLASILDGPAPGEGLDATRERMAALLEGAPDAVVVTNADGRIVLVNEQTERLFGYDRAELLGDRVERLLPERYRGQHAEQRRGYVGDPVTRPMGIGLDLTGRRKDGREFPVEIALSSINSADGVLVSAFIRDVTERRVAAELEHHLAERRALVAHLVHAGEEERQRIAADIHDDSIQVIAAAGMRLQLLRDTLTEPHQVALLDSLEQTIQLSIARLRHLLFELRPPALDRDGLVPALRMYLQETTEGLPSMTMYEVSDGLVSQPDEQTRLIIYRIAQEALTNVRKHASAGSATVALEESGGGFLITIADDGAGFDLATGDAAGHLGMAAMRERAELAGGWLQVDSRPGMGTTVQFWIPRSAWRDEESVRRPSHERVGVRAC